MSKPRILLQFDPDSQASVFDAVVAVDAGVDHLLQYAAVPAERVRDLVHGAMFTRGPQDLRSTAIFVGGSNVAAGEALLKQVTKCFFGPFRVSVMFDANGANTTAAAAVLAAARHLNLSGATAAVLAGTGPVGQRAARLLARQGACVRVASRDRAKAVQVCETLAKLIPDGRFEPFQTATAADTAETLAGADVVIAAGAAGIELVSAELRAAASQLKVAVDLNAVPPLGIAGVEVTDKAVERGGVVCYGALGVGGTKMKIHKAAVHRLFEANDQVFDAEQIYEIGQKLEVA